MLVKKFFLQPLYLLVLLLLPVSFALAATESYVQTVSGKIKQGDSCVVVDDKFQHFSIEQWNSLRNLRVDNIITFELRQDTSILYQVKSFRCTVDFSIRYYTSRDQQTPTEINNLNLVVQYDTAKGATFPLLADYRFKNAYKVIIVINSIASQEWGKELPAIFRLKNQIFIERKYPFQQQVSGHLNLSVEESSASFGKQHRSTGKTSGGGAENNFAGGNALDQSNEATLAWAPTDFNYGNGIEAYDLEWTYIDSRSERGQQIKNNYGNGSTIPLNLIAEWMTNDNTRITTSEQSYKIHLPYTDGYVLFRLRGVDYTTDDPPLRLTTNWIYTQNDNNTGPPIYVVIEENSSSGASHVSYQPNLNWQYTASYAEEGKRKEVISYFDGSLRNRQTVTMSATDISGGTTDDANQVAVVAETIYDNMGRPTMNILPAPITIGGTEQKLDFHAGINRNMAGQPYSLQDITSAGSGGLSCNITAGSLNSSSGASQYYSSNNSFLNNQIFPNSANYYFTKYVPDAQGYPFTVTQYTPDNTGRIRRQGGVGPNFQIGSGHETRYYYGKPFPRDLERLFGMEVGNASHYQKNMVVDANGQVSVSYIDANGKTIATALAGEAPNTLSPLASAQSSEAHTRLNQTLIQPADFSIDAGQLLKQSSATFMVALPGSFRLHYSIDPASLMTSPQMPNTPAFCTNCYYDVLIDVKNECGASRLQQPLHTTAFSGSDYSCNSSAPPVTGYVDFDAPTIGEYTVTYTLELSREVIQNQVDYYIEHNTDLKTLQNFFHAELLDADLSGCYSECSTCMAKLRDPALFATQMQALLAKLKAEKYPGTPTIDINSDTIQSWIQTKYTELYNKCVALQSDCHPESPCEQKLKLLKNDVLPHRVQGTTVNPSGYALYTVELNGDYKIYEPTISVLSHYRDATFPNLSFVDEDGNTRYTQDPSVTESEFIKAYLNNPDWADEFVKLHIEYCSYQWCKDQSSIAYIPNQPTTNYNERSYLFDETLRLIDNGREAVARKYYFDRSTGIDPYVLLKQDPFFTSDGRGVPFYTDMKADLDHLSDVLHYTNTSGSNNLSVKNITDFVDWMLYCRPNGASPTANDFQSSWTCNPADACRSTTNEWGFFRDYYLQLKSRYMAIAKSRDWATCTNCFIGTDGLQSDVCKGSIVEEGDGYDIYYGVDGTRIYASGYSTDGSGALEPGTTTYYPWGENALNETSVWKCGDVGIDNSSVQFSRQVYFPANGRGWYYFGFGADNNMQLYIDGVLTVSSNQFAIWKVYPVTVSSGYHTITIYGQNSAGPSAVGLEIYNNSLQDLKDASSLSDLNLLYSTKNEFTNNCTPTPPASYCNNKAYDPLYRNKPRIFNEYINLEAATSCSAATASSSQIDQHFNGVRAQLQVEIDATHKAAWFAQLQGVRDGEFLSYATTTLSDANLQTLVDKLGEVAKKYIEVAPDDDIRAASTLPSGVFAPNGATSFHDVFVARVGTALIQQGFSEELLTNPYPYNKTPFPVNPNITYLTTDIIQRFNDFKSHSSNPNDVTIVEQYAKEQLGDDYTFSSSEAFQDFYNRCANGCRMLDNPTLLPVAFASPVPASILNKDHPGVDCDRIISLKAAFASEYPSTATPTAVTEGTPLYRLLLTNYLNHRLGYSLSYSDYATFVDQCPGKTILYNKPGSPYIPVDPMGCAADVLRPVFDRAGQEYEYYIIQERLRFRNQLVSKCLSGGATAKVEGDQFEYHYTLYYYDQAGNLLKTIPPEGVKLLTDQEIDQVDEFKNSDPAATCTACNSSQINTYKTGILQSVSDLLQSGNARSLELWLNSTDGTSTRKLRLLTPDSRYMLQAAVYNGGLWAELYNLQPDGSGGIAITLSNHAYADISSLPPLQPWTHLVIQTPSGDLNGGTMKLYLDGRPLTTLTSGSYPYYPFDWTINSGYTLPDEDLVQVKHLRLYNRPATDGEVYANYLNSCLSPVGALLPQSNPLALWGRLNLPLQGTAGTNTNGLVNQGALQINSSAPAISYGNIIGSVSNTFTTELWVKPEEDHEIDVLDPMLTSTAGVNNQKYAIFPTQGGMGGTRAGMGISVGKNGISVYEHSDGYMPPLLVWPGTVSGWTHIAVVYNNRTPSLYVNGEYKATGLTSNRANVCPSYNLNGGGYGTMKGGIDQVLIWNTARTPQQIAGDMTNPPASAAPGLVGNWPLSPPPIDNSVLHDVSGYNRHTTLYSPNYTWAGANGNQLPSQGCTEDYARRFIVPDHHLPTYYAYNSQNQVVKQITPDAGTSEFWYDHLGRLAASQNAEQKTPATPGDPANRYSYTRYDALGRISEVGEKLDAGPIDETKARDLDFFEQVSTTPYPTTPWYLTGSQNRQVTVTLYDGTNSWIPLTVQLAQSNLRKRVAATALLSTSSVNGTNPALNRLAASYYSYDIMGNVKHLVQENTAMTAAESGKFSNVTADLLKHIEYEYDLISGKVNKVKYQDGRWDQFYHRYQYDDENRLISSYSSRTNIQDNPGTWTEDARYRYYLHGPLARTELGRNKVQGLDYAYTLQGWIKGVNGTFIRPDNSAALAPAEIDMSNDGEANSPFANYGQDAFAYSLGYYNGDYAPIGGSGGAPAFNLHYNAPGGGTQESGQQLFNGNISNATYALGKISDNLTTGYSYRYDQLNRLVATDWHDLNGYPTSWDNTSISNTHAYGENIIYDANGNIKAYVRNGADKPGMPLAMDYLRYGYNVDNNGRLVNNKLRHVKDAVPAGNYPDDIDIQPTDNYGYDNIGNLIQDGTGSTGKAIRWTVYGKIAQVQKGDGTTVAYSYDASGNRISKSIAGGKTTFYTRDALGNVMGVYEQQGSAYTWTEQDLYGSSRLGMLLPSFSITSALPNNNFVEPGDQAELAGKRRYELSNHLGNVMITISDLKNVIGGVSMADIISASDYYPFGSIMPGRQYGIKGRYGFNGKEDDKDITEGGQDYGMRIYDNRIGRFLSVDPLYKEYPWYTPYQFAGNSPAMALDLDGLEPDKKVNTTETVTDAGHGINGDPGAHSKDNKNSESNLTLLVETQTSKALQEFGVSNTRTRTTEQLKVKGEQVNYRVAKEKASQATVVVSHHFDVGSNDVQLMYHPIKTKDNRGNSSKAYQDNSLKLAGYLKEELEKVVAPRTVRTVQGTKPYATHNSLGVLRGFDSKDHAAILIELGNLNSESTIQLTKTTAPEIGNAIATGMYRYLHNGDSPPNRSSPLSDAVNKVKNVVSETIEKVKNYFTPIMQMIKQ